MGVLVTGGTGFLGAHVARHLVTDHGRDDVVLFDRFPSTERIEDIRDAVTVVTGDVLQQDQLLDAMAQYEIEQVAHFAFMPGTAHPEKIVPYAQMTCVGTATVFEAARLHGVRRVVNASSMAVFGPPGAGEFTEDDHPHPAMLYASCKLWTEHLAEIYNQQHGLEILSLRVCATMGVGRLGRASLEAGLMGPESRHFMAAPELAALGHAVTMPPDDQLTEFLYSADLAQAWWRALTSPRPAHSVFNLSAGRAPAGELTNALRRLLPDAEITVSDVPLQPGPLMSTQRLVDELGFAPEYTLADATEAYVDAVRARVS